MSPALTWLPSRTLISPTTPPVGCCTFLVVVSTTSWPGATTAPEISVVAAHPPTPTTRNALTDTPARAWRLRDLVTCFSNMGNSYYRGRLRIVDGCAIGIYRAGVVQRAERVGSSHDTIPLYSAAMSCLPTGSGCLVLNATTRPFCITRTCVAAARALGRCATTTAMPPRRRT